MRAISRTGVEDMDNGTLRLLYHERSEVGLQPPQEQEIAELLRTRGVAVQVESLSHPYSSARMSILTEAPKLILMFAGSLVARAVLEEVVRDLYRFFKNKLRSVKQQNRGLGYVVVLDIRVEGRRYYFGADFRDDDTLQVACYRMYLQTTKTAAVGDGVELVELETPKNYTRYVAVPVSVLGIMVILASVSLAGGLTPSASSVAVVGVLLISLSWIIPASMYRWRLGRFRREFSEKARKWASEL